MQLALIKIPIALLAQRLPAPVGGQKHFHANEAGAKDHNVQFFVLRMYGRVKRGIGKQLVYQRLVLVDVLDPGRSAFQMRPDGVLYHFDDRHGGIVF